jgi:1-acyl-sn-glycerol-3-phosphate acyltransferase
MRIYRLLRWVFVSALRQFFRRIRVCGAPRQEEGPLLILPNHPNFALDPILVLSVYERELWFLAKGVLFRHPLLARIFTFLHMIPVYRRQDDPSQMGKNAETFARATEALGRGQAIVMFPEGVSMGERKLYPIKTGAARIAFLFEEQHRFSGEIKIQPVGITYRSLATFQSEVTLTLGEPIRVSDFKPQYEADSAAAVQALTDRVESEIRELSVEVGDAGHVSLVERLTELFGSAYPERDDRELMQTVARNVELLSPQYPQRRRELEERLDALLKLMSLFSIEIAALQSPSQSLKHFVLAPFALLGEFIFYLPYRVVSILVNRFRSHPVHTATKKLALGVICFSLWIVLLLVVLGILGCSWGVLLAAGVAIMVLGVLANRYGMAARLLVISLLWPGSGSPAEVLRTMRDQLVSELESLRVT